MDRGQVAYFPRAQNPGRAIAEQEDFWEKFVPHSYCQRLACLSWNLDCGS